MSKYEINLQKRNANSVSLSPVSFVKRTAKVYPDSPAIVFDDYVQDWKTTYERCLRIAGALRELKITKDSTVAVFCRNIPAAVELSYAVPMSRGVLNMINTRLDAAGVAFILDHGEAEVFIIDSALSDIAQEALKIAQVNPPLIVVDDPKAPQINDDSAQDYETFIRNSDPIDENDLTPDSEWDALALNYTSGTTGDPKGVVYHHRGAYLNAIGNALEWQLPKHPRFLWTLPLFHCNGWCFPWTVAATAGVNICLRAPNATEIVSLIGRHRITHMCGAPIILNLTTSELESNSKKLTDPVSIMTAGAAPPPAVLERAERVGFNVTHVYGLTEVYGPTAICAWHDEWDALPTDEKAKKKARQGVNYAVLEELSVRDPESLKEVPADGQTLGEIMFRGNVVMKGYLKNKSATESAFNGGYFRSGDLAVLHPDNYIELKDRSKDIIISGGENISTIEVEGIIYKHPSTLDAAVVAAPHEKWGETPVAFVELKDGLDLTEAELIDFCRKHLAHFKCPTRVVFGPLPKTSTGKIQKFELRLQLKS